ncbi:MAG: radical SAM protein, partial [Nanoarchaeota archaeon]
MNITNVCMLNCYGCYRPKTIEQMTYEQFKTVIDKLPSVNNITLTGGEPFVHPDLLKMVRYCAKKNRKPRIVTSGFLPIDLEPYKNLIELISVTIKFPDNQYMKIDSKWKTRDFNKKTFQKSIKVLEQAVELGIPRAINFCVDNFTKNYRYMLRMVKLAEEYDASLVLLKFIPYTSDLKMFLLSDYDWNYICKHASRFDRVHIAFPSKYSYDMCSGGVNRMNILANGDVNSCLKKDTLIQMANGDIKKIKNIDIGDKVISFNEKTKKTEKDICIDKRKFHKEIFEVETTKGYIYVTKEHPFYI